MSEPVPCPRCGNRMPQVGLLSGGCPRCMLELGFETSAGKSESLGPAIPGRTLDRPEVIGRYRILRLIGEGGMGAVYEAEQDHPLRAVALKIIKPGLVSPELLRRFEQESQALGRLQHPGIAQIYEAGTVDTGFGPQPYFAMEFIRGLSPRDYAETNYLNTRDRLQIMVKICEAVHHAHQRGLIHRDLKPGNILVDETGQPKILDFGVARVADSDARATMKTDVGQLIGTLAYMSPEQTLADPLDIDTRSDVYSLGIIFYELLSGRLPYPLSRKVHEAILAIREEDPASLSASNRALRGDIETIVARALEKDRERRYASAAAMAADIQRYLNDEPIVARRPSASYQLQKFARRNKALVAGVAAVFFVLVAAVAATSWLATQARKERDRAVQANKEKEVERDRANANELAEKQQRRIAEAARVQSDEQAKIANRLLAEAEVRLYQSNIYRADREWETGNISRSDRFLQEAPAASRDWEWDYLSRRNHMEAGVIAGHAAPIVALSMDSETNRLHTVSADFTFKDWDLGTHREAASGKFKPISSGNQIVASSVHGGMFYSGMQFQSTDGLMTYVHKFWDLSSGKELISLSGPSPSSALAGSSSIRSGWEPEVAVSPDGGNVVAVFNSGIPGPSQYSLYLWNSSTGLLIRPLGGYTNPIGRVFFSPNGSRLAVVQRDATTILNLSGQKLATLENSQDGFAFAALVSLDVFLGNLSALAFSNEGNIVVAGFRNEQIREWSVIDGKQQWSTSRGTATHFAFSPDSRFIAVALADGTIRILESGTGRESARLTGHVGTIRVLDFTPDGTQLVSAGDDQLIHFWDLTPLTSRRILDVGQHLSPIRFNPDGHTLLISPNSGLTAWDIDTGRNVYNIPSIRGRREMDFSADGNKILLLKRTRTNTAPGLATDIPELQVLDAGTGREIALLRLPQKEDIRTSQTSGFRISSDGSHAAIVTQSNLPGSGERASEIVIVDINTGKLLTTIHVVRAIGSSIQFSRDGKLIAIYVSFGAEIYDSTTGRRLQRFDSGSGDLLKFSPDAKRLATAIGKVLTIWDIRTGVKRVTFRDFANTVLDFDFSPDGSRLVSVSPDGEVLLSDTSSGKSLIPLQDSSSPYVVREVTFNDDRYVQTGRSVKNPKNLSISFSADGNRIIRSSIEAEPGSVKVRVATWDGTPRK